MAGYTYSIIGGQLSDLEPITRVNFPGLPVERCLDAPRIAASVFYDLGGAKLGNFLESCTIVGWLFHLRGQKSPEILFSGAKIGLFSESSTCIFSPFHWSIWSISLFRPFFRSFSCKMYRFSRGILFPMRGSRKAYWLTSSCYVKVDEERLLAAGICPDLPLDAPW